MPLLAGSTAWAAVNATTQTVTLPTHTTGDLLIVVAACKAATITSVDMTISAGWTEIVDTADGTTNSGNGTGSVRQAAWYKIAASASETNPTVTWGGSQTASPGLASAWCWTKNPSATWVAPVGLQAAVNNATSISVTMPSNPELLTGDVGMVVFCTRDDSALTVPTWTATGATLNTVTVSPGTAIATTTSDDMAATAAYRRVTAGSASAAPVCTATQAAAETGQTLFLRLREAVIPSTASLSLATFAPTVTTTNNQVVTPSTAALATATFAPTVTASGALTATVVASKNDNVDHAASEAYVVPSWTPVDGRGYLVICSAAGLTNGVAPTLSGNGQTWSNVHNNGSGSNYIGLFKVDSASGSTTGTLSVTWSEATTGAIIAVVEVIGQEPSGMTRQPTSQNGSATTTFSATLGAFDKAANGTLGACKLTGAQGSFTPGGAFAEIFDDSQSSPQSTLGIEFAATNQTTVDMTYTPSANHRGLAVEIVAAVVGTVTPTTANLSLATFAPTIAHQINAASPTALALTTFAPVVGLQVTPSTLALSTATFAPALALGIIPPTASLTTSLFAPTVTATDPQLVTPSTVSLTTATFAPLLAFGIIPVTTALATSAFAPTVTASDHQIATPSTLALSLSAFAPVLGLTVTPSMSALTTLAFAPTVIASDNKVAVPDLLALALSTFAPTVSTSDHQNVVPGTLALATSAFAPTVAITDHKVVTPDLVALALSAFVPTVTATANQTAVPSTASLATSAFAPTVTASDHKTVTPTTLSLISTTFNPSVTVSDANTIVPPNASLVITTFEPTINLSDHKQVVPATVAVSTNRFAPTVTVSDNRTYTPPAAALSLATFQPSVDVNGPVEVIVNGTTLIIASFAPVVHVAQPGDGFWATDVVSASILLDQNATAGVALLGEASAGVSLDPVGSAEVRVQ